MILINLCESLIRTNSDRKIFGEIRNHVWQDIIDKVNTEIYWDVWHPWKDIRSHWNL